MAQPSISATFLGLQLSQNWDDFPIWETFFENYKIRTLIELGTGNGAMSTFFALQCKQRGIHFWTIDNQDWGWQHSVVPAIMDMASTFMVMDLFSEATKIIIADVIGKSEHALCIYFDNGAKAREWQIYAPLASKGDYLVVHDWETEFFERDIPPLVVTPILEHLCGERAGYKTRWFQKD